MNNELACPKCGNEEDFWVLERSENWVKVNTETEVIEEDGEAEGTFFNNTVYQCAKCDHFIQEPWDTSILDNYEDER